MPAFERAVTLGYRYLETDAHVTRDGVVVAFHDDCLDRVSDTRGAIAELTIEELQRADAGHAFSPDGGRTFPYRGRGVAVPRMEELLRSWPDIASTSIPSATRASTRSSVSSTPSRLGFASA